MKRTDALWGPMGFELSEYSGCLSGSKQLGSHCLYLSAELKHDWS
jgi:hypothetical protein